MRKGSPLLIDLSLAMATKSHNQFFFLFTCSLAKYPEIKKLMGSDPRFKYEILALIVIQFTLAYLMRDVSLDDSLPCSLLHWCLSQSLSDCRSSRHLPQHPVWKWSASPQQTIWDLSKSSHSDSIVRGV